MSMCRNVADFAVEKKKLFIRITTRMCKGGGEGKQSHDLKKKSLKMCDRRSLSFSVDRNSTKFGKFPTGPTHDVIRRRSFRGGKSCRTIRRTRANSRRKKKTDFALLRFIIFIFLLTISERVVTFFLSFFLSHPR